MKKNAPLYLAVSFLLVLGFGLSILLRFGAMTEQTGAQGLESSYHTLLTLQAWDNSPARAHLFLPSVTLSPYPGNPVTWGATFSTAGGSYIYTSFPPLGFLLPYAALKLANAPFTLASLAAFNSLIGLIAAIGLGSLCAAAVKTTRAADDRFVAAVFLSSSLTYLFLRESLVSHGSVYWPHSLSQLCLIYSALFALRLFQDPSRKSDRLALLLICAAYALLEWTGYVYNIGLAIAFVALASKPTQSPDTSSKLKQMPVLLALVTTVAGCLTLAHFFAGIGIRETLQSLGSRAAVRAGGGGMLIDLPRDYALSFGALLPIAALALVIGLAKGWFKTPSALSALLFATSFTMIENLLLTQHAHAFSFDRLKLAVPLFLLISIACAKLPAQRRTPALLLISLTIIASNVAVFRAELQSYAPWGQAVRQNQAVLDTFKTDPLAACSVYGADASVRGYLNQLFHKDIFEGATAASLKTFQHDACGMVLIHTQTLYTDLPRVTLIEVFNDAGLRLRSYPALQ